MTYVFKKYRILILIVFIALAAFAALFFFFIREKKDSVPSKGVYVFEEIELAGEFMNNQSEW